LDMDNKKSAASAVLDPSVSLEGTNVLAPDEIGHNPLVEPCFPKLKELYLSDCTFLTDAAIVALSPNMPRIEVISLSFCCALTDLAIEALLDSCAYLRKLDLSFCGSAVSDASLYQLAQLDAQEPGRYTLEELEIRGCVRVTEHGVREIIKQCPNLRRLNVSSCSGIGTGELSGQESPMQQAQQLMPDALCVQATDGVAVPSEVPLATGQQGPLDCSTISGENFAVCAVTMDNTGSSGSLAMPAHGVDLARKMDALKRGKEWALAQQRPGLTIIV